jgi:hypothetical protein
MLKLREESERDGSSLLGRLESLHLSAIAVLLISVFFLDQIGSIRRSSLVIHIVLAE